MMKKKLFLTIAISMLCLVAFAFVVCAKDVDIQINDVNGNSIVLPTVDTEGDSLTWYRVTEKPTEGNYFEYLDKDTTYYIVSVKTKDAAYVNDNYRVCYSYPGLKAGAWSGNIIATNIEGITHADGKGPKYYNFVFEGTPVCYVYIPASMLELSGTNGNSLKSLFYGCSNLVELDIESGSLIEELNTNGFYNCKKLQYIRLPENLKKINANSFVGINLTVVVPKSVTIFEASNWSSLTVQFTGNTSDHTGWAYQPSNISYVEHCDAYYNGQHLTVDDFDCTTPLLCANCGKEFAKAQDSHDIKTSCTYENGFLNAGCYESKCQNQGCTYVEKSEKLDALFICLGYAVQEYGNSGIAIGYAINNKAIDNYKEITGATLKYGGFVALKDKIVNDSIFGNDGNAVEGAKITDISDRKFDLYEFKVTGITDDYKSVKLAMGVYVAVTSNETTKYAYLQNGTLAEGEKYVFTSYNELVNS